MGSAVGAELCPMGGGVVACRVACRVSAWGLRWRKSGLTQGKNEMGVSPQGQGEGSAPEDR